MEKLNISWMYPDILNLHGDRGNLMALKKVAEDMSVEPVITRVENFEQKIDFENSDILFFNVGEIKSVNSVVRALKKQEDELKAYVESGKMIILVGATGAAFANKLTRQNGDVIYGLQYLDMECTEVKNIYGDDLYFILENYTADEVIGTQISMVDTHLKSAKPLGKISYGKGNNGKDTTEGAVYKNVIFTNCLGPMLVKNPWFAQALIKTAMETKNIEVESKILDVDLERKSAVCIKRFIREKQG